MNEVILRAALGSIDNVNLDTLTELVLNCPNPEIAAMMILGKYEKPLLAKTAKGSIYSEIAEQGNATLTNFNALKSFDGQVEYEVSYMEEKWFSTQDDLQKWVEGKYVSDYRSQEASSHPLKGQRNTVKRDSTSIERWSKYSILP